LSSNHDAMVLLRIDKRHSHFVFVVHCEAQSLVSLHWVERNEGNNDTIFVNLSWHVRSLFPGSQDAFPSRSTTLLFDMKLGISWSGVKSKDCAIDGDHSCTRKLATETNQIVLQYVTVRFGRLWIDSIGGHAFFQEWGVFFLPYNLLFSLCWWIGWNSDERWMDRVSRHETRYTGAILSRGKL
jgi:hypothetical protein